MHLAAETMVDAYMNGLTEKLRATSFQASMGSVPRRSSRTPCINKSVADCFN